MKIQEGRDSFVDLVWNDPIVIHRRDNQEVDMAHKVKLPEKLPR